MITDTDNIIEALTESIDALGDISAENATEQQQEAYRLCLKVRDEIIEGEESC